ncbi:Sterol regulatory element-binding protein cleavage-activating protein [Orchesella cincta]|uniref:Sterol regulatory element-binding protein cleavage-activating protein n=1 Tax=Orchesella cincta TaxID=48709 RepID=A0A1D2MRY1_ORCCI|nr:Sterol regulatory element-binding protein cleavage-activating protein [Orchesella cincta]
MDGGDVLVDEDESARFIISRSSSAKKPQGAFSSGRRKPQNSTGTGEYINTENEARRYSKGTGMSDRKSRSIPERVGHFYYSLGLLCSSHPILILIITTTVVALSCLPLLSLPLPGNHPQEFIIIKENYSVPPTQGFNDGSDWPRWYKGPPIAYIQQVIVKSAVVPWTENLVLTDAYRGPLAEVFSIVQSITSGKANESIGLLAQNCFHVGTVKSKALKGKVPVLPENGCLLVSPANFWQRDYSKFQSDPDIVNTILNYQIHQKGRSGLAEILLGINVRDTGLKRHPFKARQRLVTYAVTIALRTYNEEFITSLQRKLQRLYSSDGEALVFSNKESSNASGLLQETSIESEPERMFHVYFPSQSSLFELIPLVATYCAMFLYVYFSMNKIDIVTSKLGMAFSALATVVASLCMSVGLCSLFGMSFEVNARAIYPYLVIVIGLENILVLTRSVVSTAPNLDMKIRVAQGLSKEGWSITKNLLAEVTILTIGFFTFVPAIQEFCILAIIGLLSDFFLQTFFFATVLSIDIHRQKGVHGRTHRFLSPPLRTPIHPPANLNGDVSRNLPANKLHKVKSNSELNGNLKRVPSSVSVVAPSHTAPILVKIPKRLRVVYFWARTRFFQRTFTIFMVGWISVIIYESGIVAHFKSEAEDVVLPLHYRSHDLNVAQPANSSKVTPNIVTSRDQYYNNVDSSIRNSSINVKDHGLPHADISSFQNPKMFEGFYTKHPYIWRRLSLYHWQVMMGIYNISLVGGYITILPPISISVPVKPEKAVSLRHPLENENAKYFNWHALANAFEPIDLVDEYDQNIPTSPPVGKIGKKALLSTTSDDPYVPSSPIELALTMLLAIPSVVFIAYLFVVLYKCVCSRNYAEWRESWMKGSPDSNQDHYTQVVFEALPLKLDGHRQEVECIGSDGNVIASVCLAGNLKIWNSSSGENITTVNRSRYFAKLNHENEDNMSGWCGSDGDSAGCSPPSIGIMMTERSQMKNHSRKPSLSSLGAFSSGAAQTCDSGFDSTSLQNRISSAPIQVSPQSKTAPNRSPPVSPPYFSDNTSLTDMSPMHRLRTTPPSNPASPTAESRGTLTHQESYGDDLLCTNVPPVWCLDCHENLIVLGTGSGRLEIWDGFKGVLKSTFDDGSCVGIMCVKLIINRIVVARINGSLDFIDIEPLTNGFHTESSSPYHRWHGGEELSEVSRVVTYSHDSGIRCVWLATLKAHQQPIVCLDCEGGRLLTGSQDHTIKVFRLEDHTPLYTLHGHYGPITCLFIDKFSPMTSGSGSQDGMLCVWDLITGMCMYSIQAHDGPVSGLTYSASYIISVGGDDKICVWERFQGHILNTIHLDHTYCPSLVMLTHNLLITSKRGSLIVWDVRSGEPVRAVRLGHRDNAVFVRQIMSCGDAILCDYGSQLRLVRFPSVVNKID